MNESQNTARKKTCYEHRVCEINVKVEKGYDNDRRQLIWVLWNDIT